VRHSGASFPGSRFGDIPLPILLTISPIVWTLWRAKDRVLRGATIRLFGGRWIIGALQLEILGHKFSHHHRAVQEPGSEHPLAQMRSKVAGTLNDTLALSRGVATSGERGAIAVVASLTSRKQSSLLLPRLRSTSTRMA
jgi:hypothetical protein